MEELRKIAIAHYQAGPSEVKRLAVEFFRSMDTDGDGRVDRSEFLAFMWQEGYLNTQNHYFFNVLDRDGNGTLDFYEVMTFYYIIKSGRPFCDGCRHFIPETFFSCVECFKNTENSFDLCLDCYRSARYRYTHNHGGRAQFLDNYTLLQVGRHPPLPHSSSALNPHPPWNLHTNAIVPDPVQYNPYPVVQHSNAAVVPYWGSVPVQYNQYNTHVVQHPTNAAVPASSRSQWSTAVTALQALESALNIGNLSATLCTIL